MFTIVSAFAVNRQRSAIRGGIHIDINFLTGGPPLLSYAGKKLTADSNSITNFMLNLLLF